jgi:hypothetical protein
MLTMAERKTGLGMPWINSCSIGPESAFRIGIGFFILAKGFCALFCYQSYLVKLSANLFQIGPHFRSKKSHYKQ